jgi:hypothetical protein
MITYKFDLQPHWPQAGSWAVPAPWSIPVLSRHHPAGLLHYR